MNLKFIYIFAFIFISNSIYADSQNTTGDKSPIINNTKGDVIINYDKNKEKGDWKMLIELTEKQSHERDYESAKKTAQESVGRALKEFGKRSYQLNKSIGLVAACEIFMGNYNSAILSLRTVVNIDEITFNGNKESLIVDLDNTLNMVTAHIGKKEYSEAQQYMIHADMLKQAIGHIVLPREMYSIANVEAIRASLLAGQGEIDQSIEAANKALEKYDDIPADKDGTLYGVYESKSMLTLIEMAKMAKQSQ